MEITIPSENFVMNVDGSWERIAKYADGYLTAKAAAIIKTLRGSARPEQELTVEYAEAVLHANETFALFRTQCDFGSQATVTFNKFDVKFVITKGN
jgi:hypothetical protein